MESNPLLDGMSIAELKKFRKQWESNESVVKIVDGYIEIRLVEETNELARQEFIKQIDGLVANLPHPSDVANVYMAWREVEVADTTQEAEVVDVVDTVAEVDGEGNITTPAVTHQEPRYPTTKVNQWVVELNKGFAVSKANGGATPSTSKRTINIFKHNPNGADESLGEFANYQAFATSKGITVGTDSARRAVEREGYYGVATS